MRKKVGKSDQRTMSFNFVTDPGVYGQIVAIAEEREWTVQHVLRKIVPLGLEVYLAQTTLPHSLVLSGKPAEPSEEVPGDG